MRRLVALALLCGCAGLLAAQPLPRYSLAELEQAIGKGRLGKIAVLAAEQHGERAYFRRFDGRSPDAPVDIRSAGKSITALAVGAAIADGKLAGTEVRVWPYLDAARGEPFDSVTVADLLSMASALDCNDADGKSPGAEEKMYRTRVWRTFALALPAREGGGFSYCTAGVFLLGQVVEKATGERFDAYVQRRLFDPLGIEGVVWKRSASGEVQSGGQLTIGAEALLRIGRMVLDRGVWRGERIVPPEWIDAMLTPRHRLGEHVFYGYLWWASAIRSPRGHEGAWMMQGNGGNIVAILRDYDAVLVVQARNYNRDDADRHSYTALAAMLASLEPPPPAEAK